MIALQFNEKIVPSCGVWIAKLFLSTTFDARGNRHEQTREPPGGPPATRKDPVTSNALAAYRIHEKDPIHLLGLEDPGRAGLIEEGPEDCDEAIEKGQGNQRAHSLHAEELSSEGATASGHVDEALTSQPEDPCGQEHEGAGSAEGHAGPVTLQENGSQ